MASRGASRDSRSGSINTEADHIVFELLRALSDAVIVGAGTIRVEGYTAIAVAPRIRPIRERAGLGKDLPLVTVSRAGFLPPTLSGARQGDVLLATSASAPGIADARSALGADQVLVCGEHVVAALSHEWGFVDAEANSMAKPVHEPIF